MSGPVVAAICRRSAAAETPTLALLDAPIEVRRVDEDLSSSALGPEAVVRQALLVHQGGDDWDRATKESQL